MPRPKAVDAVIGPDELHLAFAAAHVPIQANALELDAACDRINAGLTSLAGGQDRQLGRQHNIRSALVRIAGGDFRGIGAFMAYVRNTHDAHTDVWSVTSNAPQWDDPVVVALRDAALSLPVLREAGDAPEDDAPAPVMIVYLAEIAAKAFDDGIERTAAEQAIEGRRRSAIFGSELIAVYVSLTGRRPSFSRTPPTAPIEGLAGGPLIRFLTIMYKLIREKAPTGTIAALPDASLDPSAETLCDWILAFRADWGAAT